MRNKLITSAVLGLLMFGISLVYGAAPSVEPHRVEVTAKRFSFDPGDLTLKKGEPVILVLKSVDVAYGLRFRELGVDVKAGKGTTSEVQFTPQMTGDLYVTASFSVAATGQ
jgi:cytochrome c oxidase subunit 2